MALVIERVDDDMNNVSTTLKTVIVGSFAVLGSLQLRELVKQGIEFMLPELDESFQHSEVDKKNAKKNRILMISFMTVLIFLIVVVLAVAWRT
jgi:hypothetical protein